MPKSGSSLSFVYISALCICSDSVSPAFLIRVGASISYSDNSGDEASQSKENIYEEIKDKAEPEQSEQRKSSSSSDPQQTKSKFQKALAAVTGRSEKSFHLSISKGRKKSLIDKAKVDWDCYGPSSKLNKSSSDMMGLVADESSHHMSQLKLDVEVTINFVNKIVPRF